jgi:hypothetical protein
MEAQGDEGTVRHRRKLVVLGTALPAASEARHSGHRLAPTGKGLPTRLPRSGLVQDTLWKGRYLGVWSRMMRNLSIKKQGNDVQGTSYLTRNTPDKISP